MKKCMDSENLHRRLSKIIGQVQAIDRMVDEDVPCEDVLAQINALKKKLYTGKENIQRCIASFLIECGMTAEKKRIYAAGQGKEIVRVKLSGKNIL